MPKDLEVEVRTALLRKGMSLKRLAELLEISQPYLSDILAGKRDGKKPKEHIKRIKKILNI